MKYRIIKRETLNRNVWYVMQKKARFTKWKDAWMCSTLTKAIYTLHEQIDKPIEEVVYECKD